MKSWRLFDFLVHHLPYAVVAGAFLLLGFPPALFGATLPLTLLTSLSEALSAAQAAGCLHAAWLLSRLYLLLLMPCVVAVEVYEAALVLLAMDADLRARVSPMAQHPHMVSDCSTITSASTSSAGNAAESLGLLRLIACGVFMATLYHVFVVIPSSLKAVKKQLVEFWGRPVTLHQQSVEIIQGA